MLPPEITSAQIYAGPGSAPMQDAAMAWDDLAAEFHAVAAGYHSVIAGLAESWNGPSSMAMAAAATRYTAWITATAAQAKDTATRMTAAASAYETAFAATVPPAAIAANRSRWATLQATNIVGQNTAAIAAADVEYAQMWLQNATTMYRYAASAAAAVPTAPFTAPPQPVDSTGSTGQSAAVAGAAAGSAGTAARSGLAATGASGLTPRPPLHDVLSAAAQYAADADGALGGLVGSSSASALYEEMFGAVAAVSKVSTLANAGMSVPNLGLVQFKTFFKPGTVTVDLPASALGAGLHDAPPAIASDLVRAVSAAAGDADLVGRLSVPPSWAATTPAIRLAATALPEAALAADIRHSPLPAMALGSAAGTALVGSVPRVITAGSVRGRTAVATATKAPAQLDRVIAQLQRQPNAVQHWNVDQAGLDDLIAALSKKPGVHAVHLSKSPSP